MVPYYFWGPYNVAEMNSSTNVTRNPNVPDDKMSPAASSRPTTRRLRRLVRVVADADRGLRPQLRAPHAPHGRRGDRRTVADEKNVDYVVRQLSEMGTDFLAHVVGECKDEPNLKQIFSKSSPIRC